MSTQAPKFRRGQRVRGIFSEIEREIWEEPSPFKLLPSDQPFYASRIIGDERSPINIRPQREFEASHEAIEGPSKESCVIKTSDPDVVYIDNKPCVARVEEVLDAFDWEAVRVFMDATDWKWHIPGTEDEKERPSFSRLRRTAKRILLEVAQGNGEIVETGGFCASLKGGELRLEFILTSAEVELPRKDA